MKRLICSMIASMNKELYNNVELIEMLVKHKNLINYDTIKSIATKPNANTD
jgi:hypothetical protein